MPSKLTRDESVHFVLLEFLQDVSNIDHFDEFTRNPCRYSPIQMSLILLKNKNDQTFLTASIMAKNSGSTKVNRLHANVVRQHADSQIEQ